MHVTLLWDLEDDPRGNVAHIAEHGLTKECVENAVRWAASFQRSRSSDNWILFGPSVDGRMIAVVFEFLDDHQDEVYPITAYRVE